MPKIKRIIFCQNCKQRVKKEEVINLEIRGRKWRVCEDCSEQIKEDEEYRSSPPCQICYKPVREEDMMFMKDDGPIHEKCYDGRDLS